MTPLRTRWREGWKSGERPESRRLHAAAPLREKGRTLPRGNWKEHTCSRSLELWQARSNGRLFLARRDIMLFNEALAPVEVYANSVALKIMRIMRVWSPRLGVWTTHRETASKSTSLRLVMRSEAADQPAVQTARIAIADQRQLVVAASERQSDDPWGLSGPVPGA